MRGLSLLQCLTLPIHPSDIHLVPSHNMDVALNIIHSPKRCTDHSVSLALKRNVTTSILSQRLKMSKKVAKKTCYKLQFFVFFFGGGGGGGGGGVCGGGHENLKTGSFVLLTLTILVHV